MTDLTSGEIAIITYGIITVLMGLGLAFAAWVGHKRQQYYKNKTEDDLGDFWDYR